MPSERSSLLSLQRRQQQDVEKQRQKLELEQQYQQQLHQRESHYRNRNNRQNQPPIDLLSDDDNDDIHDCKRSSMTGRSGYNPRHVNLENNSSSISLPKKTNNDGDLIQLNDGDIHNVDYNHYDHNQQKTKHEQELQNRRRRRIRNTHLDNNENDDNDDVFDSINGIIHHNVQEEQFVQEEEQQIEILNSFDEEEDEGNTNSTSANHFELLDLGPSTTTQNNSDVNINSNTQTTTFIRQQQQQNDKTSNDHWMDGTFYVNHDDTFGKNNNNHHQSQLHLHPNHQSNQSHDAKQAISTLFGSVYNNDNTTGSNNTPISNPNHMHSSHENVQSTTINTTTTTTTTNDNIGHSKQFYNNRNSSLLDQAVDVQLMSNNPNNVMNSPLPPPQSMTNNRSLQNKMDNSNMNTTATMKTIRSPLQISTSSMFDPELFMSSQQQNYEPNLSSEPMKATNTNIPSSSSYLGNIHGHSNSKITFRHTTAATTNTNTTHGSSLPSNEYSKYSNNNVDTARSWFGGNLNTNTGSTIPSSSMSIATSSSSSTTTTTTTNEFKKKNDTNPYVHVIGSSKNHTLPEHFHHQQNQQQQYKRRRNESNHWNWLNIALFVSYGFTTAANLVPITLIPTIAMDLLQQSNVIDNDDDAGESINNTIEGLASKFASVVATYAVLGTALGKFLNGSLGDIFGARRVACYFSLLHSFSLLMLSFCVNEWSVICCCVAVEYYQSVQWPCIAVILATHYGNGILGEEEEDGGGDGFGGIRPIQGSASDNYNDNCNSNSDGKYEKGIYIASLGSRGGALFASLTTTMFLRYGGMGWRGVARLASFGSFLAFAIMYLFVTDSPKKLHDPQNPIKEDIPEVKQLSTFTFYRLRNNSITMKDASKGFEAIIKLVSIVFFRNILPSLRSVLSNVTFWVVAIAHSGGLMVCSSIRILGTYFRDTSYGAIPENQAGFVSLFLSVGILVGLFVGGNIFGDLSNNPQARKSMVSKLYILTVAMCYTLSFLAIPLVRNSIHSPYIIAFLQAIATFVMGAGVAVQVYCIPAIVGCTFGANKGLYASYTDGVAYTISSLVWRIMGNAVEEGNPEGAGWAYGWAAVALLVVLAGFLMVEFVEHYFCRGGWIGRLRDAEARAKYDRENAVERSFGDDSSVSMLAESGRRIWERSHALFRPITLGKRREPDMNSILSMEDDDDDVSTILFENASSKIDHAFKEAEDLTPPDELQSRITELLMYEYNKTCVDCGSPYPRWVTIIAPNRDPSASEQIDGRQALGAFCCSQCAGSHRKLGTHLAFVRSIDHDNFNANEVHALEVGGNAAINCLYETNMKKDDPLRITPGSSLLDRERFIVAKYEKKIWYQCIKQPQPHSSFEIEPVNGLGSTNKYNNSKESPSSVLESTNISVFEQVAPVDQDTIQHYESFVRNGSDSQSEYSQPKGLNDEGSVSSGESDTWQISGDERGLDVFIDL